MAGRVRFQGETAHPDHPYLGARKQLVARALIYRNLRVLANKRRVSGPI